MKLRDEGPGRSLPLWLAVSLALNLAMMLAAANGLAARRGDAPQFATVLQGMVMPSATEASNAEASSAPVTNDQADAPERPQPHVRLPISRQSVAQSHRSQEARPRTTRDDDTRHDGQTPRRASSDDLQVPERTSYSEIPQGKAVSVKASHYGHDLGAGLPGAGRTGGGNGAQVAGGGSEVLVAQRPGSSFNVGGIPAAHGAGPGLGGTGSGIGVGGSGSGIGMPGSGDGLGMGGQGGSAKTPKLVASSGQNTTPAVPAARGAAGGGTANAGGGTGSPQPAAAKPVAPKPAPKPVAKPVEKPKPAGPTEADLSAFRSMVQRKVANAKTYPQSARRNGYSGRAKVSFSVGPSGKPSGVSISSSSGYSALDAAATRAVNSAAPFTPFPKGLSGSITVNVTVNFTLN